MIKTFIQGNFKTDRTLFRLLGANVISPVVHEELGVPVTGEDGDVWILDIANGSAVGFAQLRACKNGEAHLRYLYSARRDSRERLVRAALEWAEDQEATHIYTNARKTDTLWARFGFVSTGTRRGSFVRWEHAYSAAGSERKAA